MVELVEDCLDIIFGYLTPVEWIQISEVCQVWKMAVQKQWRKTTAITCWDDRYFNYKESSVVDIPKRDATKIVLHAAQFCSSLKEDTYKDTKNLVITIGSFTYHVKNCTFEHCLQLLAKSATELNKVQFVKPPKPELLQLIFKANKIQTISCDQSNNFWRNISSMKAVENLELHMSNSDNNFKSFEGLLPNLKTFKLVIDCSKSHVLEKMLSLTLPHIRCIKSLNLSISQCEDRHLVLKDVFMCFNLEKLSLSVELFSEYLKFDENLNKLCPRLQVVTLSNFNYKNVQCPFTKLNNVNDLICSSFLDGFAVTNSALHSLLSLSDLEKLEIHGSMENCRIKKPLPEVVNLSEFSLYFDNFSAVNMTDLCDAVKKMPKLERLRVEGLDEEQPLKLTCEAIEAATSQGKVIIVEQEVDDDNSCRMMTLEIQSKRNEEPVCKLKKHQTLTLQILQYSETYFDDIKMFLQRSLPSLSAVSFRLH